MKFFVTMSGVSGWPGANFILVAANTKEDAREKINIQLSNYGRQVASVEDIHEWNPSVKSVAIISSKVTKHAIDKLEVK